MEQKLEGKWAAEASDFYRLFQRLGGSIFGLFVLQLAWVWLILQVAKLAENRTGPPAFRVPWPSGPVEVEVGAVWLIGAGLILLVWLVWSGWGRFLRSFAELVAHVLVFVVWIGWLSLLGLVNIPLYPITWGLERYLVRRWKQRLAAAKRAEYVQSGGEEGLEQRARDAVLVRRWILPELGRRILGAVLDPFTFEGGGIGLAPFIGPAGVDDSPTVRAAEERFELAADRLKVRLGGYAGIQAVPLTRLSAMVPLTNEWRAEVMRVLLRLDAVVWGKCHASADGTIWLHFQTAAAAEPAAADDTPDWKARAAPELFPMSLQLDLSSLRVTAEDPGDAYTVLLLVYYQVFADRLRAGGRGYGRYTRAQKAILRLLEEDAFEALPDEPIPAGFTSSARMRLAELVGTIVGHEIARPSSRGGLAGADLRRVYRLAGQCAAVLPDRSEPLYRLGAVECLLRNEAAALGAFRKARDLAAGRVPADPIHDGTLAQLELRMGGDLAQFAAHAARAISTGDSHALRSLREKLANDDFVQLLDKTREAGKALWQVECLALSVVRTLLEEAVPAAVQASAYRRWRRAGSPTGGDTEFWAEAEREFSG